MLFRSSPNKADLYKTAEELKKALEDVPGLDDLSSDLAISSPQINVTIDRDRAASVNVNANSIENAFYDAYGPRWVSTIFAATNQYKVLLELKPEFQRDPRALSMLYFKAQNNQLIPLDSLATVKQEVGPQSISHFGQLPAVTLSFNLKPGYSLGDVVQNVQNVAKDLLPPSVGVNFQGAAKAFESSLSNLAILLFVAVLVVYIVLGILYES